MMGEKRELRDSMSIEEATVSSMWEMAAIVGGPATGAVVVMAKAVTYQAHS